MKKYKHYSIQSKSSITVLSTVIVLLICKSFAYGADDNLAALQKDVLAAKEQLSAPQSSQLLQQAEKLIDELAATREPSVDSTSKEITPAQTAVKKSDEYKFKFPSPMAFPLKPSLEAKKPWIFNPMTKRLGFGRQKPVSISDGEALYKVAVSDEKITLREAIDIGVANSLQLRALAKKIEVAQGKWMEAKRAMFPTVQIQYDDNGGKAPNGFRFYQGRAYKINANQPLYYGGELALTVKQAEENKKSSEAEYEKGKNELIHQIRTAYYGVVKSEYNAQYQVDLFKEVSGVYKILKSAYDQKYVSEVDYLNVESQYQQVSFSVDTTNNDVLAAYLTLRQALNLDAMVDLPVDLRLHFKKLNVNFDQILEFAVQNNAEVLVKELAYISAKDGVEIAEAKKKPRIDLRGSYGKLGESYRDTIAIEEDKDSGDSSHNIKPMEEWYLGVHGSMPLGASSIEYDQIKHIYGPTVSAYQGSEDWRHTVKFNLLDKFADLTDAKNADATLIQAEADWQKARNDLIFKLKDEYYVLKKAMLQMDSTVAKIRYQEKRNGILKYTMSLQDAPASDYLEGLIDQAVNRYAFIQAVADYHVAVSSIEVQSGDPFYLEKNDNAGEEKKG